MYTKRTILLYLKI